MRFTFATLSLDEIAKEGLSTTSSMFLGTYESSSDAQLYVTGSTSLSGSLDVSGSTTITGSLDVTGDVTLNSSVTLNTDGYLFLPSGSTAERPGSPRNGMIRYNTTTQAFEGYNGGWYYFQTASYGG